MLPMDCSLSCPASISLNDRQTVQILSCGAAKAQVSHHNDSDDFGLAHLENLSKRACLWMFLDSHTAQVYLQC